MVIVPCCFRCSHIIHYDDAYQLVSVSIRKYILFFILRQKQSSNGKIFFFLSIFKAKLNTWNIEHKSSIDVD